MKDPVQPPRIDHLPRGTIHAVGAAGLETAAMVRFLVESGRTDIVLHDTSPNLGTAIERTHRFQPRAHVAGVKAALQRCGDLRQGAAYLAGIEAAAAILVPVAWFIHRVNAPLMSLQNRFIKYPDACFDLFPGPLIGVTGSAGKTTTARFAATLLNGLFCGNDREACFDLAALAEATAEAHAVFELSNRHLRNGFRRVLDIGMLTGIALNHEPDHGSFERYRAAKYSMASRCRDFLYHASVPASFPDAVALSAQGSSYGPKGKWRFEGDAIVGPGEIKNALHVQDLSAHNLDNAVGAAAAALLIGVPPAAVESRSRRLKEVLPRYRQSRREIGHRLFVNDAASCMPASSVPAVAAIDRSSVLICGGDRQRYRVGEFDDLARAVARSGHVELVCTMGPMAPHIETALRQHGFDAVARVAGVEEGVERALALPATAVVFSPGCGTGSMFTDKYARGEEFDEALAKLVPAG